MSSKTELDPSYIHQEGSNPLPPDEMPFYGPEGRVDIPCLPSKYFTGMVSETSHGDGSNQKAYGVLAMANINGGLFCAFSSDELLALAKQCVGMAADIERFNLENV